MPSEEPNIDKAIVSRFKYTPEHLIETIARYRSQHRVRGLWTWIRILFTLLFLAFAVLHALDHHYFGTVIFVALTIVMFVSPKLDDILFRSRLKKSPDYNTQQTFIFSESVVFVESEMGKGEIQWKAFQRAVIFDDGVLLFRGMGLLYWIPYSTLENDDAVRFRDLVSANTEASTR